MEQLEDSDRCICGRWPTLRGERLDRWKWRWKFCADCCGKETDWSIDAKTAMKKWRNMLFYLRLRSGVMVRTGTKTPSLAQRK